MKIKCVGIVFFAIIISYSSTLACSSFMLKTESEHIFGHNLDISGNMPGMVFINKRGMQKRGHTWEQISSLNLDVESNISWISRYGSVTFNAFGRELPDGGMNEEGLFIWEMTGGSTFDKEAKRPRLFMSQWIQYQLDNFNSVNEVLVNLSNIGLDGWNWHFFIADKEGETAAIEFIDGVAIVHTKNTMPIPLMGNGRYSDDLSIIQEFDGFGGNISLDINDQNLPGMLKAAKMMKEYSGNENIVEYGYEILEILSGKVSKWSVIFDVKNMTVYFRTTQVPNIKSFSVKSFDFSSDTPVKMLNIQDTTLSGDAGGRFIDFNDEANTKLVKDVAAKLYSIDEFEIPEDTLVHRLATAYKTYDISMPANMEGIWTGYAEYPTTGDPAIVDWKIVISSLNGQLEGKITDSAGLFTDTELKSIIFENGILRFTAYSYGYVFRICAKVSKSEIEGIINFSDESRKGNFSVQMN